MHGQMKKLWYAVSGRGQGRVFTTKPERDDHFKVWLAESVGCISMTVMLLESEGLISFPDMTWQDDPIELELSITVL